MKWIAETLKKLDGVQVHVVHPNEVKWMTESRGKTDRVDDDPPVNRYLVTKLDESFAITRKDGSSTVTPIGHDLMELRKEMSWETGDA